MTEFWPIAFPKDFMLVFYVLGTLLGVFLLLLGIILVSIAANAHKRTSSVK